MGRKSIDDERRRGKDKAKDNFAHNGKFSARHIRAQAELAEKIARRKAAAKTK